MLFTVYVAFLVATVLLALWKGGPAEKGGALIVAAIPVASYLTHLVIPDETYAFDVADLVVDAGGLVGFVWLAHTQKRFWPYVAAAFQLVAMVGHVTAAIVPNWPLAYALLRMVPISMVFILVAIATLDAFYEKTRAEKAAEQDL